MIAIIGSGIAGLSCAYHLQKKGMAAHVYEASDRLGGRIDTAYDAVGQGLYSELGAEFINSDHDDLLDLVDELGLQLLDTQADYRFHRLPPKVYFFEHRFYSEQEIIAEFNKVAPIIADDQEGCDAFFCNRRSEQLDNTSLLQYVNALPCAQWLKNLFIYTFTGEYGMDAAEQSALNFITTIDAYTDEGFNILGSSDERYKVKGGNALIIQKLRERITAPIHTGHKLTAISGDSNRGYQLDFENGERVTARFVVLALPFTQLRKVDMQIAMTPLKRRCIDELGYGANNKLILGTQSRIWREQGSAGYLMNEIVQNAFDSSQLQQKNQGNGSYTLLLGGRASQAMAVAAAAEQLENQVPARFLNVYLKQLEHIYPGFSAVFNGQHRAALWSNKPFFEGGYTSYKVGQWTSLRGTEIEPIGNIFFAGEHCSLHFQGYMNGAVQTAKQAAEALWKGGATR